MNKLKQRVKRVAIATANNPIVQIGSVYLLTHGVTQVTLWGLEKIAGYERT